MIDEILRYNERLFNASGDDKSYIFKSALDFSRIGKTAEAMEKAKAVLNLDPSYSQAIVLINQLDQNNLTLPPFQYRGIKTSYALTISRKVGSDFGVWTPTKTAHELALKSLTRAEYAALYMVGRDIYLGIGEPQKLPQEVQEAGPLIYHFAQERNEKGGEIFRTGWHRDGILTEPEVTEIPGKGRKPTEDHIAARYFSNIERFTEDLRDIIPNDHTVETRFWLAQTGWAVPTSEGLIDENGLYRDTLPEEKKQRAIRRLAEYLGITRQEAENELTYQFRVERERIYAVGSGATEDDGPILAHVDVVSHYMQRDFGSFPASRSATERDTGVSQKEALGD